MFKHYENFASRRQRAERRGIRQFLAWLGVLFGALASLATPAPAPCPEGEIEVGDELRVVFRERTEVVKLRVTSSGPCAAVEEGDFELVACPREPRGDGGYGGLQFDSDDDSGEYPPGACGALCTCGRAQDETFCVARRGADSVDVVAAFSSCPKQNGEEEEWVQLEIVSD